MPAADGTVVAFDSCPASRWFPVANGIGPEGTTVQPQFTSKHPVYTCYTSIAFTEVGADWTDAMSPKSTGEDLASFL